MSKYTVIVSDRTILKGGELTEVEPSAYWDSFVSSNNLNNAHAVQIDGDVGVIEWNDLTQSDVPSTLIDAINAFLTAENARQATALKESILGSDVWVAVRTQRNEFLEESDWTQIPDAPLNETQKQAWATYRQKLRDITSQENVYWVWDDNTQSADINIVWPPKPQ